MSISSPRPWTGAGALIPKTHFVRHWKPLTPPAGFRVVLRATPFLMCFECPRRTPYQLHQWPYQWPRCVKVTGQQDSSSCQPLQVPIWVPSGWFHWKKPRDFIRLRGDSSAEPSPPLHPQPGRIHHRENARSVLCHARGISVVQAPHVHTTQASARLVSPKPYRLLTCVTETQRKTETILGSP